MKGVVFEGVEQVAWRDLADPVVESPGDAIVAVELAGMCGSDLHPYFGRETGLDQGTVMGHEFVGRVVEAGKAVQSVRVGDRVFAPFSTSCGQCYFCQRGLTSRCSAGQLFGWRSNGRGLHGGQAQFVRVPLADGSLKKVPEGLSAESALLLGDNFSTGFFCAELGAVDPRGVTAVIGCGSVGLLAIVAARLLGAGQVVAIDPVADRRERAEARGATAIEPGPAAIALVRDLTEGRGADSVLELVGLPAAQELAFELIRPGGTMAVIGCHTARHFSFSPVDAYDRNLTYRTGRCPARHYMDLLAERVAAGEVEIDSMITHRFDPAQCVPAYDLFAHQRDGCIKAVMEFCAAR